MQRVMVKEFMPVTLCASRDDSGAIKPKPGCEVLYKTTRADFAEVTEKSFTSALTRIQTRSALTVIVIFLITYIPAISMTIPRLTGFAD